MTTTKLHLTLRHLWVMHERHIRDGAIGAAMVVTLLLIHRLLNPIVPPAPIVIHDAQRAAILIATATPAPTQAPQPTPTPWPTPEPLVIMQEAPTPPPEVIYVQVPVPQPVPIDAAPTPEPPTLAPQQLVILDRNQWAVDAAQHRGQP